MAKFITVSAWLPAFGSRARRRAGLAGSGIKVVPAFVAKNYNNLALARPARAKKAFGNLTFIYVLVGANLILFALYFFGINQYTAKGYELRQAQQRLANLRGENKKLIQRVSENASILQIQNSLAQEHFVPVSATEFLQLNQFSQK